MEIIIKKIDSHEVDKSPSDIASTFLVMENGKKFSIICKSNRYGRSIGLEGKDGTLHTSREDNRIYRQTVALGGGCGLIIDDELIEGLSPIAIRGVILAEQNIEAKEINIKTKQQTDGIEGLLLLIDGIVDDFHHYPDVFGDLAT